MKVVNVLTVASISAVFVFAVVSAFVPKNKLDISDRNQAVNSRIFFDPNELIQDCQQNFTKKPCNVRIGAVFNGPNRSSQTSFADARFPIQLRNLVSANPKISKCEHRERNTISTLLDEGSFLNKAHYVTMIPNRLSHCFGLYAPSDQRNRTYFLIVSNDTVIAWIHCTPYKLLANPTCLLEAYPIDGKFKVSISPILARNIRTLAENAGKIITSVISSYPSDEPSFPGWDNIPNQFVLTDSANKEVQKIESFLGTH